MESINKNADPIIFVLHCTQILLRIEQLQYIIWGNEKSKNTSWGENFLQRWIQKICIQNVASGLAEC